MAAQTQSHPVEGYTIETLLSLSYGTFKQLKWTPQFAGEVRLVGMAEKWEGTSWEKEMIIEASDVDLTITSQAPKDGGWDSTEKNKKNIDSFIRTFEQVKRSATEHQMDDWSKEIERLRTITTETLKKEEEQQEELEKVMHLSNGSRTITYTLIGINISVFILMVINGVGVFEPESEGLIKWGADYSPYTLSGEWWRLVTCIFVHIGVIHLLFNMYALYMIGNFLEPMIGKLKFIIAYICTGVFSSLLSLWWHKDPIVSAGASGAIFGLYGIFLALLTTNIIPKATRKALLQSIGIFIFYNLAYGMKSGIDNAAHLGGLLSGFVIGYIFYPVIKLPTCSKTLGASAIVLVACIVIASSFVNVHRSDYLVYNASIETFGMLEDKALKPLADTTYTDANKQLQDLITVSLPAWKENKKEFEKTRQYKLDTRLANHRTIILDYIDLRIEETELYISIMKGNSNLTDRLKKVQEEIHQQIEKLNKLGQ